MPDWTNLTLWTLQALLTAAFLMAGTTKAFRYDDAKRRMPWVNDVPRGLVLFIGLAETAGAIGLLLPQATGILAWLTPAAAVGLAVVMVFAAGFHIQRREPSGVIVNLVLLLLVSLVAAGRWTLFP